MPALIDITATTHALVDAIRTARAGPKARKDDTEAYVIARAVWAAIRDGKVPLVKYEHDYG